MTVKFAFSKYVNFLTMECRKSFFIDPQLKLLDPTTPDTWSEIYYQNARDYTLTMTTFTCRIMPAHIHQTLVKISCTNCAKLGVVGTGF